MSDLDEEKNRPGKIEYGEENHVIEVPASEGIPFKRLLVTASARFCVIQGMIEAGWEEEHFSALDPMAITSVKSFWLSRYMQESPWFKAQKKHRIYYAALRDENDDNRIYFQAPVIAYYDPRNKAVTIRGWLDADLPTVYEVERVIEETCVDLGLRKQA